VENSLNKNSELIEYIDTLNERIWNLRGAPEEGFDVFTVNQNALEKATSINYTFGMAQCHLNAGMGYFVIKNNQQLAFENINIAYELFKQLNNKKWIANTYLSFAIIHNTLSNPELALYYGLRGISYFDENDGSIFDKIMGCYILGTIYKDLKKFTEAESYYTTGLSYSSDASSSWLGRIYSSLANIYTYQQKYDEAIEMSFKALEILKSENNSLGESRSLTDIGIIYKKQKKYNKALHYFFDGLKIRESKNVKQFILTSLLEIGDTYLMYSKNNEALDYFLRAEIIALELNLEQKLITIYQEIATAHKLLLNYPEAVVYFEKLFYVSEKFHQKQIETKLLNVSNELIAEKEAEIERLKNVELKAAYQLIALKNKEILESMRYASRIQKALLPSEKYIDRSIKNLQ
jgi:tetratricopeptide (TPR) repeat protein